jgi:DNA-binding response OmpR family regulator
MPRILIIDDDLVLSSLYRIKFQAAGFVVEVAETGEAGLLKLRQNIPDIVLLDLMLGDMNGVEVLETMRKHEATRSLPVVVFSSAFMGNLLDAAVAAGAAKCLSKTSCPPNRLVDEVKAVLVAASKPPPGAVPPALRLSPRAASGPSAVAAPATEDELQGNARRELLENMRQRVDEAQRVLPQWVASAHVPYAPYLPALYRTIRSIAGSASLAGRLRLGQVTGALEAMLKELRSSPTSVTTSVVRTVSQAVGLLPALVGSVDSPQAEAFPSPLILLVAPELTDRLAVSAALERAQLRALAIDGAGVATVLFAANRLDLVITEEQLLDASGHELCSYLRESPENTATPVILLTAREDVDARLQLSGGVIDPITKPFLPIELAVKALIHLHRGRLAGAVV